MMIKLKPFIPFLPLIGLMPNFQGTHKNVSTNQTIESIFNLYKKEQENSKFNGNPGQQKVNNNTGILDSSLHIFGPYSENFPKNVTGKAIKDQLLRYIGLQKKTYLNKDSDQFKNTSITNENYTFWVRSASPSSNDKQKNTYKKLTDEDTFSNKISIDVLVAGDDQKIVSSFVERKKTTHRTPTAPKKNQWTKGQIGSAMAAGVVVAIVIGGIIYFFFIPKKKVSSSRSEEEQEGQETNEEL